MAKIKGVKVVLIDKRFVGYDDFNKKQYEDIEIEVDNVLIAPSSSDDIVNSTNLYGKKAVYTLAIPKGDTNIWQDKEVRFYGQIWRVFGKPLKGIDELIPLAWNKKVMVEAYE